MIEVFVDFRTSKSYRYVMIRWVKFNTLHHSDRRVSENYRNAEIW